MVGVGIFERAGPSFVLMCCNGTLLMLLFRFELKGYVLRSRNPKRTSTGGHAGAFS